MTNDKSHLGGHYGFTSMFLHELDYIKKKFDIKSMLDVGCGLGGMVEFANYIGIHSVGIDGDASLPSKPYVHIHDFVEGPVAVDKKYDLTYSIEFLEHVYEEYMPNYMPAFQCSNYIFCSGATPGQGGWHHVNEQFRVYWIEKFAQHGFSYDAKTMQEIIEVSKCKEFMSKNAMFFVNNNPHTIVNYDLPYDIENLDDILSKNIDDFVNRGGSV